MHIATYRYAFSLYALWAFAVDKTFDRKSRRADVHVADLHCIHNFDAFQDNLVARRIFCNIDTDMHLYRHAIFPHASWCSPCPARQRRTLCNDIFVSSNWSRDRETQNNGFGNGVGARNEGYSHHNLCDIRWWWWWWRKIERWEKEIN